MRGGGVVPALTRWCAILVGTKFDTCVGSRHLFGGRPLGGARIEKVRTC